MPSRIIREGWLESERLNSVDASAERFFLRLCLRADDFGRFHANPILLKAALFPLSEVIRSTDIPRWLAACEAAGLVRCYDAEGKRFIEIPKFNQRTRAEKSKFPEPPQNDGQLPGICLTGVSPPRTYSYPKSGSETDSKVAPKTLGEGMGQKRRERNALADALAAVDGSDPLQVTGSAWGAIGKALKEIKEVTPGVTPAEIARRARNYARAMKDATISPSALAKHWARCDFGPASGQAQPAAAPIPEPIGWKTYVNHEYPSSIYAEGGTSAGLQWHQLAPDVQLKFSSEIRKQK